MNGTLNNYTGAVLAAQGNASLLAALLAALPCAQPIHNPAQVFTSGVYCFNGTFHNLEHFLNFTMDARGDEGAVFVFQINGTFTGRGGQMNLANGARACNIFVVINGDLQPIANITILGTWLVAGNVVPLGALNLTGALYIFGDVITRVGVGAPFPGLTNGNGSLITFSPLTITACECFLVPTPGSRQKRHHSTDHRVHLRRSRAAGFG